MENRWVGRLVACFPGAVRVLPTSETLDSSAQLANWYEYQVDAVKPVASTLTV